MDRFQKTKAPGATVVYGVMFANKITVNCP
jgi:hypothetical protein